MTPPPLITQSPNGMGLLDSQPRMGKFLKILTMFNNSLYFPFFLLIMKIYETPT